MAHITSDALQELVTQALVKAGFSFENVKSLADQTLLSEKLGQPTVGLQHLFDYFAALQAGRINGAATPVVLRPRAGQFLVDCREGLAQRGYDTVFPELCAAAREIGAATLMVRNAALSGAIGTYVLRLAERGLVGLAAANGQALQAGSGTRQAVFSTNPIAFAVPRSDAPPILIDQSTSATAFVNIRAAAEDGREIPSGWALDGNGNPTTDAQAALTGTLLPFGGTRGANLALMVELLAAGLTGANWSLDCPSFFDGNHSPGAGLFVLALAPVDDGAAFQARLARHMSRLAQDHGLHVPGEAKARHHDRASTEGLDIPSGIVERLRRLAG